MTIIKNKNKWDTSNVSLLNDNYIHYNKHNTNKDMEYIDYGLSIINADTFKNFNNSKKFDLADFYSFLSKKNEFIHRSYNLFELQYFLSKKLLNYIDLGINSSLYLGSVNHSASTGIIKDIKSSLFSLV